MGFSSEIVDDEAGLESLREEWDDLAVRAGQPFSAPSWALAWWRNAAPPGTVARVAAVWGDGRLALLAPLHVKRAGWGSGRYEVMSSRLAPPASLLVEPGCEPDAREELMRALAAASPRPASLRFWDRCDSEGQAESFAAAAPGRSAWVHRATPASLPLILLDGLGYDGWFAKRSSKFRQEARRRSRRLEEAGASIELATPANLERVLDAFIALHGARWEDRGGSNALVPGLKEMLREAATEMLPTGRLRIYAIEAGGEVIAVNILVAAGAVVNGWSSGFDEEWRRHSPALMLTLKAVADAAERGEGMINMGPGRMDYKLRLADAEQEMALTTLVPRGRAYAASRLRFLPQQLRADLGGRLSEETKSRLRRSWPSSLPGRG